MLLPGIRKLQHLELGAYISLGVVLLDLCGTKHPLHPFQTSGLQEMQDARPNHLFPNNPRSPIPEDLQEVLTYPLPTSPVRAGQHKRSPSTRDSPRVGCLCFSACQTPLSMRQEDEPTMEEEVVPIAESSELVEVTVEQLDDSSHYHSFVSSGASNFAASTSGATSTGIATSGATSSGATFSGATTSATTSSSQVFSLPPFRNLFLSDITMNIFNLK